MNEELKLALVENNTNKAIQVLQRNKLSFNFVTLCNIAEQYEHLNIVFSVLKLANVQKQAINQSEEALSYAIKIGSLELVRGLLKVNGLKNTFTSNKNACKALLEEAIVQSQDKILIELLKIDELMQTAIQNNSALSYAAENGRAEIVNCLLNFKLVKKHVADNQNSAFSNALNQGHAGIASKLLDFESVKIAACSNNNALIKIVNAKDDGLYNLALKLIQLSAKDVVLGEQNNNLLRLALDNMRFEIANALLNCKSVIQSAINDKAFMINYMVKKCIPNDKNSLEFNYRAYCRLALKLLDNKSVFSKWVEFYPDQALRDANLLMWREVIICLLKHPLVIKHELDNNLPSFEIFRNEEIAKFEQWLIAKKNPSEMLNENYQNIILETFLSSKAIFDKFVETLRDDRIVILLPGFKSIFPKLINSLNLLNRLADENNQLLQYSIGLDKVEEVRLLLSYKSVEEQVSREHNFALQKAKHPTIIRDIVKSPSFKITLEEFEKIVVANAALSHNMVIFYLCIGLEIISSKQAFVNIREALSQKQLDKIIEVLYKSVNELAKLRPSFFDNIETAVKTSQIDDLPGPLPDHLDYLASVLSNEAGFKETLSSLNIQSTKHEADASNIPSQPNKIILPCFKFFKSSAVEVKGALIEHHMPNPKTN